MKRLPVAIKILLPSLFILTFACTESNEKKEVQQASNSLLLPVFGEKKLSEKGDTVYHSIGTFSLQNQYKETITEQSLNGKITVADFFFATCTSICPKMSTQLKRVQQELKNDSLFQILSHTVNPMHDSAEVLFQYSDKYGAIKGKWHFLTGAKKSIYDLAKTSYLVNALEDDGSEEGFLHSELFLLVDPQRRVRGIYDGTDSIAVNGLIQDIQLLKKELSQTSTK